MIGLDIETTGLRPQTSNVSLVQTATAQETHVVDAYHVSPAPLLDVLKGVPVVAHNAKFEWQHIRHAYGVELNLIKDTMLMEQILDAGDRHVSYSLEAAVQ